ncbi:hypothetical protein [Candidatus Nitrospira inopinata]|jgi:hypothetical protein|uniref:Uncharacterized protein n=1 Tax=Candidatus Nitrospira inopinata TaxID=1715989 RepID=A0A0S4KSL7_9BACT|nr:hypothetical protein [Candidatus Nitrospira inopinata]CUQ66170.1 protein of unknown function [Candidatus Nitrospira inopinata]
MLYFENRALGHLGSMLGVTTIERDLMGTRGRSLAWLLLAVGLLPGCAGEFVMFHSESGSPILIARRAYSADACVQKVKEDAARLGVTFRYIHLRGNLAGRSLLWPLEPGYACEAAIGPEQLPIGAYPNGARLLMKGS